LLRSLYSQLAKQEPMGVEDPSSPARQLYGVLFGPVEKELRALGITTLLISADTGLQGVPYAALHDGSSYVGERFALSLTPSIGLLPLNEPLAGKQQRLLALGASKFEGLAPLPLVPQELNGVGASPSTQQYLNRAFTPQVLLEQAGVPEVTRVHVATHAEFLPGGPSKARLYAGTGPMNLTQFSSLRQRRQGVPLELFVLSACRTALGDSDSELGFAGLALQAGSRSAIGTLWYVDDVATSAFFVLFYRNLDRGLPKAEALQATRIAFAAGSVRLVGNQVVSGTGSALLTDLSTAQQRRIARGMQHPYFWGGIQLLGMPL
jgi:CHAT domain-containing protein